MLDTYEGQILGLSSWEKGVLGMLPKANASQIIELGYMGAYLG